MTTPSLIPEPSQDLYQRATLVRRSANVLSQASDKQRKSALIAIAKTLELRAGEIVRANHEDLNNASKEGIGEA